MRGEVVSVNVLPYRMFLSFLFRNNVWESSIRCLFARFFVEGSILAQDERWRRA